MLFLGALHQGLALPVVFCFALLGAGFALPVAFDLSLVLGALPCLLGVLPWVLGALLADQVLGFLWGLHVRHHKKPCIKGLKAGF